MTVNRIGMKNRRQLETKLWGMSFVRSDLGLQAILLIQKYIFTSRHATSVSVASGRYTKFGEYPKLQCNPNWFCSFFQLIFWTVLKYIRITLRPHLVNLNSTFWLQFPDSNIQWILEQTEDEIASMKWFQKKHQGIMIA